MAEADGRISLEAEIGELVRSSQVTPIADIAQEVKETGIREGKGKEEKVVGGRSMRKRMGGRGQDIKMRRTKRMKQQRNKCIKRIENWRGRERVGKRAR